MCAGDKRVATQENNNGEKLGRPNVKRPEGKGLACAYCFPRVLSLFSLPVPRQQKTFPFGPFEKGMGLPLPPNITDKSPNLFLTGPRTQGLVLLDRRTRFYSTYFSIFFWCRKKGWMPYMRIFNITNFVLLPIIMTQFLVPFKCIEVQD